MCLRGGGVQVHWRSCCCCCSAPKGTHREAHAHTSHHANTTQFFEGHLVVDGDAKGGANSNILQATSGSGPNRQTFTYTTDRVVGNGSFGVVFQATCLETGDTVSLVSQSCTYGLPPSLSHSPCV